MGCDIHAVIEYRADEHSPWQRDISPLPDAFDWRNYAVFAVLADVRNYEGLPTIVEPRNLPDDYVASDDVWLADDDPDIHSTSWLTVGELEAFDWDQSANGWLLISEPAYLAWRQGDRGDPGSGCRGTGNPVYTEAQYLEAELAETLPGPSARLNERPFVRVEWSTPLREFVPQLCGQAIEHMRALGEGNNVRVVFGFDN